MPRSLKAHQNSLDRLRLSIKRNGFPTQRALAEEAGFSLATVKKFLAGKPVDFATFSELCQVLNLDWQDMADLGADRAAPPKPSPTIAPPLATDRPRSQPEAAASSAYQDWGEAPDSAAFYGRAAELTTLQRWLSVDRCRLVTLVGMGGIGKTTLAVQLAHQLQGEFDCLIWRSLRNAPAIQDTLSDLLQSLSAQSDRDRPQDSPTDAFDHQLRRLVQILRNRRCLIILDNVESILQVDDRDADAIAAHTAYRQLFQTIGETQHHSCLLLTSREWPRPLAALAGDDLPMRCLTLTGLDAADGRELLQAKGSFTGSEADWLALVAIYGGNPLALKIVAPAVQDYFEGSLTEFLALRQQTPFLFEDIRQLLAQQFERLTPLERSIMYWLAISREPIPWRTLRADLVDPTGFGDILQAIDALAQRSLIEKDHARITQQPVIMDYLLGELVEQVCGEIKDQTLDLLRSHALVQADAKNYIHEAQARLILQPIVERLRSDWPVATDFVAHLSTMLTNLKGKPAPEVGYGGGNLFNLLRYLQVDLQTYDLGDLILWQANCQGLTLHDTRFANSDLSNALFNQPFGSIRTLTFSPDGQSLATGDTNSEIWIWQTDLVAGEIGSHRLTLRGHRNWICAIAFRADGQQLVSGSADRTIKLWEARTGTCLQTLEGHTNWVMAVVFSADGQCLASGSADHTIKLWDASTGQCRHTLAGHARGVWSIAFSPDGDRLVSGSVDRTIKLWDVATGKCLHTFAGHEHGVWSVAFSPQGTTVASGSADRTIKLWDLATGQCRQTLTGHRNWVWSVAFSPCGGTLASSSADQTVQLWEVATGKRLRILAGHQNWVWSVAFSPQGDYLASGSEDRTMRLWRMPNGQCLKTLHGSSNWVWSVAFSPEGDQLASGHGDRRLQVWEVATGNCLHTLAGSEKAIWSVHFNPQGDLLASGNEDGKVRLWQLPAPDPVQTLAGHSQAVWSVAFDEQGHYLASGSADHSIRLWEVATGNCCQILQGHQHWVCAVAFQPQSAMLASGSYDRTLKLWDRATGNCLQTLSGHLSGVWAIAFAPQGDALVSGSIDQTIRLWDVKTGACRQILRGHTNWVMSVAVSPDGQYLASGSADHTVKLWNMATGDCIRTLEGHRNSVWSVTFSPNGQSLASGSDDKTIKLWSVATGQCLQTLKTQAPYEGMDITGVVGLTSAQVTILKQLGAVEKSKP